MSSSYGAILLAFSVVAVLLYGINGESSSGVEQLNLSPTTAPFISSASEKPTMQLQSRGAEYPTCRAKYNRDHSACKTKAPLEYKECMAQAKREFAACNEKIGTETRNCNANRRSEMNVCDTTHDREERECTFDQWCSTKAWQRYGNCKASATNNYNTCMAFDG